MKNDETTPTPSYQTATTIAWQYYLYREEGFDAVIELAPTLEDDAGLLGELVRVWESMERGDFVAANRETASREQRTVIQDNYDLVWAESPATKALMIVSSLTAVSPVAGGQSLVSVVGGLPRRIPLVSDVDDRWDWIQSDMIGAFTDNVIGVDPELDPEFQARIGDVVDERRFPVLKDLVDYEPTPL